MLQLLPVKQAGFMTHSRTMGYDIRCQTGSRNIDRSVDHHDDASNINLRMRPVLGQVLHQALFTLNTLTTDE